MKRKLLLAVGTLAILAGCGQQPNLEVGNVENNQTSQQSTSTSTNQTIQNGQYQETDLTDNTVVQVDTNSVSKNQQLASDLSKEVVYFDFDKYNIRNDQMPTVEAVANLLKDKQGNYTVRIEGNCDEWGSDEYNYALGLKRAKIVKQALINLGIDKNKLTIISYGKTNPVCTAHTKECWAKNRRDNFTLLP